MNFYAGIGSRKTPVYVCSWMTDLAIALRAVGYKLRSGRAAGADMAFELGARQDGEYFVAKDATPVAIDYVSNFHPAWERCSAYARNLHGRNSQIILGRDLTIPVKFVVCYTDAGQTIGGTATGIRMAQAIPVPVFNVGIFNEIAFEKKKRELLEDIVRYATAR